MCPGIPGKKEMACSPDDLNNNYTFCSIFISEGIVNQNLDDQAL